MLAVSAQCGCCHHSFILCPICLVLFGYIITWLYYCIIIILHGFVSFFFLFCITWCMCYQDYGLCYWWGVLFCCLCTTTFLCVPYGPYATYSFIFFLFCVLCTHFFFHCYPYVFFFQFVCFFSRLDENFLGCVGAYVLYAAPYMCSEMGIHLIYFAIVVTIGQDSSVRHAMF